MLFANGLVGSHRCRFDCLRQHKGHQEPVGMGSFRVAQRRDARASVLSCHPPGRPRLRPSRLRCRLRLVTRATSQPRPAIMVNSCTGKVGRAAAEAVLRAGLPLVPMTITGEPREVTEKQGMMIDGPTKTSLKFIGIEDRETSLREIKKEYPNLIIVDFTLPSVVNENGQLYGDLGLNFVMGTTGGDREKLMKDVLKSGVYAVIAPQMGKQIVAVQAMLKYMSDRFPGAFSGYSLSVTESHQSSKVDTSGTAKAISSFFLKLGAKMDPEEIVSIRDPETQMKHMGVPKEALSGHGYHTYHLSSPDNTVSFEFQHNVVGRTIYAEGTVDAVLFLARHIEQGTPKKVFDMIDVLEAGSMR